MEPSKMETASAAPESPREHGFQISFTNIVTAQSVSSNISVKLNETPCWLSANGPMNMIVVKTPPPNTFLQANLVLIKQKFHLCTPGMPKPLGTTAMTNAQCLQNEIVPYEPFKEGSETTNFMFSFTCEIRSRGELILLVTLENSGGELFGRISLTVRPELDTEEVD
ncbi:cellular tumor antigen p53-like [Corythoichthys intestinalis]|uniref:cellular tumor antigen p53-like n=1 Tax=Corythoichthys intestinalis TaxID=161448 RepID=UPI0025A670B8|nr:cellular tumor antigen p53-like [Corythoichthys intestinalis]